MSMKEKKGHPAQEHPLWPTYTLLIRATHNIAKYSTEGRYKALSNNLLLRANKLMSLMHKEIVDNPGVVSLKERQELKNAMNRLEE